MICAVNAWMIACALPGSAQSGQSSQICSMCKLALAHAQLPPNTPCPPAAPALACRVCSGMCTALRRRWWCWASAATAPSCRPSSSAAQVGLGARACKCGHLRVVPPPPLRHSHPSPTCLTLRVPASAGVLRLPLLDLTPPWGSPIRPGVAAAISTALDGFSAARDQPPRLVGPDTCWVVVLYARVFCCHHDRRAGVLRLYRLFRCAAGAGRMRAGRAGPRLGFCGCPARLLSAHLLASLTLRTSLCVVPCCCTPESQAGASPFAAPGRRPTSAACSYPCRDATSLAHTFDVYAQQLELSVVDNILVVSGCGSACTQVTNRRQMRRAAAAAAGPAEGLPPCRAAPQSTAYFMVANAQLIVARFGKVRSLTDKGMIRHALAGR